jgi:energy-coupling factor transporter ATP-binding protein EcfA2
VSFTVERELVGPFGPNGAGKTTTVSMIAGVGRPDRATCGSTAGARPAMPIRPGDALASCLKIWRCTKSSPPATTCAFGALYGLTGRALDDAMARAPELVELASIAPGIASRRSAVACAESRRRPLHDPDIVLPTSRPWASIRRAARHLENPRSSRGAARRRCTRPTTPPRTRDRDPAERQRGLWRRLRSADPRLTLLAGKR